MMRGKGEAAREGPKKKRIVAAGAPSRSFSRIPS